MPSIYYMPDDNCKINEAKSFYIISVLPSQWPPEAGG